jgi:PAS domain S-box-containing protein
LSQPLQVLIVEDSENDALLLEIELQRAGHRADCLRVETREAMSKALSASPWDIVIADYVLPRFNGLEALALVKEMGLDLPFIIVSGHISDNTAVAAMKAGAHDYVMKDNLARLGPAVQRELREAEVRRERQRASLRLEAEQGFRTAIEDSVPAGITAVDLEGRQTYVNPAFCAMVGWTEEELLGARAPYPYWPAAQARTIAEALDKTKADSSPPAGIELTYRRKNGERLDVLVQFRPLRDASGSVTGWVSATSDITSRKRAEVRLAAEHAVTRILASATSLEQAAKGVLPILLGALEADLGALWIPNAARSQLRPASLQLRSPSPDSATFLQALANVTLEPGEGLVGRVWKEQRAISISEREGKPGLLPPQLAPISGLPSAMAFPVHTDGQLFGVLEFRTCSPIGWDAALLNMMAAIGSDIGQFVRRRRAEEALRRTLDELELRVEQRTAELQAANTRLQESMGERRRLETELLEITEKERRRIGLDLHDDLGQKLSGIALMTKGLELKLAKANSDDAEDAARIHNLVQEAMNHASDLAHEMATLDVGTKDLPTALRDLARHTRELYGITCRLTIEGDFPEQESSAVTQLVKIAQEAVTNAVKHGKAKRVAINLAATNNHLTLTILNSGVPFPDLHGQQTGMGLRIMNYRANLIGGSLDIRANGPQGTLVTCTVPLAAKPIRN